MLEEKEQKLKSEKEELKEKEKKLEREIEELKQAGDNEVQDLLWISGWVGLYLLLFMFYTLAKSFVFLVGHCIFFFNVTAIYVLHLGQLFLFFLCAANSAATGKADSATGYADLSTGREDSATERADFCTGTADNDTQKAI